MPANSILIADDDEKLLSVLLSYFKDEQFTVYLARDLSLIHILLWPELFRWINPALSGLGRKWDLSWG